MTNKRRRHAYESQKDSSAKVGTRVFSRTRASEAGRRRIAVPNSAKRSASRPLAPKTGRRRIAVRKSARTAVAQLRPSEAGRQQMAVSKTDGPRAIVRPASTERWRCQGRPALSSLVAHIGRRAETDGGANVRLLAVDRPRAPLARRLRMAMQKMVRSPSPGGAHRKPGGDKWRSQVSPCVVARPRAPDAGRRRIAVF